MKIERIVLNGKILAYIIRGNSKVEGKHFGGSTEDFLQVGVMRLDEGTELKPHYHPPQRKTITMNQEVLIILSGKVEALFFDVDKKTKVDSSILESGDIIVLLEGGHGFNILKDTKLIEVKQGPYQGQEKDKKYVELK